MNFKSSKIHWHNIAKHGFPPRELRIDANGLERVFLVKTECGLRTSYMFEDGSGFSDIDGGWAALEWAYTDN